MSASNVNVKLTADVKTCAPLLSVSRAIARKIGGWTDRACVVLDQGDGSYAVETYEGVIVWEGSAHCEYCARREAISHMAGKAAA